MKFLPLVVLLFSLQAWSQKSNFCQTRERSDLFQAWTMNSENMMGFDNDGGAFNQGVCWWHSRFQRNAYYLVQMDPSLPRPTDKEVKKIIKDIRWARGIIKIAGFETFREFTLAYQAEIQKELNHWQIFDGALEGAWVDGLTGRSQVNPVKMKAKMDYLFQYMSRLGVAYQKLQLRGFPAHSWLVTRMDKTPSGYQLFVVDSNYEGEVRSIFYNEGDRSLSTPTYGEFVPYIRKSKEEEKLKSIVSNYCKF